MFNLKNAIKMKKFFLSMLIAMLTMIAAAQETDLFKTFNMNVHKKDFGDLGISSHGVLPVNTENKIVGMPSVDGWTIAGVSESYDRQTQNAVYPMTKRHSDGFIGCTWTNEDNPAFSGSLVPMRGVGYAFSKDGAKTWSKQENRIGGIPLYWPSYAQWGANGEAILARSADTYEHNGVQILDGLVLLTRENKGQGEWNIVPVPYPVGFTPNEKCFMAWARMTTSGDKHQYIHIMTPMRLPDGQTYKGYQTPILYYRTQNGGATWDIEAALVPEMIGQEWNFQSIYIDGITFAPAQGDMVACSFIAFGYDAYILRSRDNGSNWESIRFFDSPIGYDIKPSEYADTVYIPAQGCIALDNKGKIHVAFSVNMAVNSADEGSIGYWSHLAASFLTYWNEDMKTIDGSVDYVKHKIYPIVSDYFDWGKSNDEWLYVNSTVPQLPIIGYFTPISDEHNINFPQSYDGNLYGIGDWFSFPQMIFDTENKLHLTYLGMLDDGVDETRWRHHPFYTTTSDGGKTWTKTEYLVNDLDLIDREFAYLTLAGVSNTNRMYLMAQIDPYAGTYIGKHHAQTQNYFYFFHIDATSTAINDISTVSKPIIIYPNPTTGELYIANVEAHGHASLQSVEIFDILGKSVLKYEKLNMKHATTLDLSNVPVGVYFVTIRSENAKTTQKLIKK